MYKPWKIDGKSGKIQYLQGEVVYQTKGVVVESVYKDNDNKWYIEEDEHFLEIMYNGFNEYYYRQDGK